MKTRTKTLRKGALLAGIAVTSTGEVLDGGENWTLTRTLRDSLGIQIMFDKENASKFREALDRVFNKK